MGSVTPDAVARTLKVRAPSGTFVYCLVAPAVQSVKPGSVSSLHSKVTGPVPPVALKLKVAVV